MADASPDVSPAKTPSFLASFTTCSIASEGIAVSPCELDIAVDIDIGREREASLHVTLITLPTQLRREQLCMSSSKKSSANGVRTIYDSIIERLSKCKPLINDARRADWHSLSQELEQIAKLAENFTEQRSKLPKGSHDDLADGLDQEGVNLWNISGLLRTSNDESGGNSHIASLRLAAFRLIEAGLEARPGTETLIHVLHLANKAGMGFVELGKSVLAATVLTSAAKYEALLRTEKCSDEAQRRAMMVAKAMYFCTRMEAAWKEGNQTVADFMLRKITDDNHQIGNLPPHFREGLAHKLHQIGKSILQKHSDLNGPKPPDAVQWLQQAFAMAEQLEDKTAGHSKLKISILRTMARAHFLSESYDRAEAVLDELAPIIDTPEVDASIDYQEIRWLRLAVLRRRKAAEATLLDAFKSIINHMEISEDNIHEVLQELRTLSSQRALVTSVHQHFLKHALRCHRPGTDHIPKLVLSLIIHLSKDEDRLRVAGTLEDTFTSICDAEIEFSSVASTACLTLLWQYGGRHYKAKKWAEAAEWYLAGSHKLFQGRDPSSVVKCYRKTALCYIEKREYVQASAVIRRCPPNEAATIYVLFLIAIQQGLEDEAINAIQDVVKAPDFDRRILILATQISHRSDKRRVLLVVLESLLRSLKVGSGSEAVPETMTLLRCIIKLILGQLVQPATKRGELIDNVIYHFRTTRILAEAAVTQGQKAISLISKDLSWLWRTAYNCAFQGCYEWDTTTEQTTELFNIARELLEISCCSSAVSADAASLSHLANATFAAVSGKVFAARSSMTTNSINEDGLSAVLNDIKKAKKSVAEILEKDLGESQDSQRLVYFLHALRIFQAEFSVHLKAWNDITQIVEEAVQSGPSAIGTYEVIADILWLDKTCPLNLLYYCLEAILSASLQHSSLAVEKFSRWLRTICTISLSRNTDADRTKAIGYIEQALTVMNDHSESHGDGNEVYPLDERQWLLATAYNTGTECLHSCMFDDAKRWFEAATVICRFVPGGKAQAEKISETYTKLLAHYQSRS